MEIKYRKNESAESLINKAKNNVVRNLTTLAKGEGEVFDKFREYNPEFSAAVKQYCGLYKKLQKNDSDTGLLEEFDLASKKLIKSFRFSFSTKDYGFLSDNYIDIKNSPLYLGLETIFDASLFREPGKQRLFKNAYNLSTTIRKVEHDAFVFYAKPYFYYVNATKGEVLRRTDLKIENFCFDEYVWDYQSGTVLYNGDYIYHSLFGMPGKWKIAASPKTSGRNGSGTTYNWITFSSDKTEEYFGGHFGMAEHQVIALCWYGLNSLKFCVGSASLLTIDHMDGDSRNNSIHNLAILTRMANIAKEHHGTKGINFIMFFEICGYCNSPFDYRYGF